MQIKVWNIEALTGYKPFTTFYEDFSIAEMFCKEAVEETYKSCFEQWKGDYKYFTELVMVLNWKIWEHFQTNKGLAKLYDSFWAEADAYATQHFKGSALRYFYETTD